MLISLPWAVEPVAGYTTEFLMHGHCKARLQLPSQPNSPWPVLTSHPADNRRLSWTKWLLTYKDGILDTVIQLSTKHTRHRVT